MSDMIVGMFIGGAVVALFAAASVGKMSLITINARYGQLVAETERDKIVVAAQSLLAEVTQYRRMHSVWRSRVAQKAEHDEFAITEIDA